AGRSAIRWSPGLWAKLMPDVDQETDEEIAAEEIGGATLAVLALITIPLAIGSHPQPLQRSTDVTSLSRCRRRYRSFRRVEI
ncbi:hypothetical protein, partial [Nocardia gipuzkoensis]|uniref:hypothetical protein n=1 Tax=Nocardia gipuzkoensis TaxID=2749991 RepID=UPI001C675267